MTPAEKLKTETQRLYDAAIDFASGDIDNPVTQLRLCEKANDFAKAQWAVRAPPKAAPTKSALVLPFGRAKGKSISDATRAELIWVHAKVMETINQPDKAKWRAKNLELADGIDAELAAR